MNYVFDVDGTLTPSRGEMDKEFANWMEHFTTHNACYLVTGSDRVKTREQVPASVYDSCMKVFQCSGNHIFEQNREIHKDEWMLSHEQNIFLLDKLHASQYGVRTGQHFDHRPGLCNFSIVGRGAGPYQRQDYIWFDEMFEERSNIAKEFNKRFGKEVRATVAGETGLDITPVGKGKAQILKWLKGSITFFGDKTMEGGNDHDLAAALEFKNVNQVDDWRHTWKILSN